MGLDTMAYRKLTLVPTPSEEEEDDWPRDVVRVRHSAYSDFAKRCPEFENGSAVRFEECERGPSCSYSTHSWFRNHLSTLLGYEREDLISGRLEGKPFVELLWFSDCDGALGTEACARLAEVFGGFETQVFDILDVSWGPDRDSLDRWKGLYSKWREIFTFAAQGGFVQFH